ncbi:MAG: serpin family protein [bacterium]
MKKTLFISFLVLFLSIFLISCGSNSKNENGDDSNNGNKNEKEDSDKNEEDGKNGDEKDGDEKKDDGKDEEKGEMELKYKKADEHAKAVSKEIVEANSGLAMRLFKEIAMSEPGENVMISPLSISIAMAMVTNGASEENLEEMKNVLGFGKMEMETVNKQFYELIQSLVEADKDLLLTIANSVWMDEGFESRVFETFLNALIENYEAEPYAIDFSSDGATDLINGWVKDNTNGKIEEIVEEIGADVVMYLINAIYFKAAWTVSFDKDNTYEGTFTTSSGEDVKVELMSASREQEFDFYSSGWEEDDYSVVRIPYGREKFAFYGVISNDYDKPIDELIEEMEQSGIDTYFKNLSQQEVPVVLPKFKFEYEKPLVETFQILGMEKAFIEGGFLNLAENGEGLYISDIKHKTFIEVNEEGTEAAAVTSVEVGEMSSPSGFYGTRPFAFFIRDDRSGTILFAGKVEDPTKE